MSVKIREFGWKRQVEEIVGDNMNIFAGRVVRRAKQYAPVDTGNLRRSIVRRGSQKGKTLRVQTETGYGAFVELGTVRMAPQPFLAPAMADEAKALIARGKLYD